MKINKSRSVFFGILLAMFALMLLCNSLTDLLCDDYAYCYSFATKERITSVLDIFPSLYAHGNIMNGRAIAHFFAQLFLFLPSFVFKIVNSAFFVLQIVLIYFISRRKGSHNNLLFISVFGAVWVFQPCFGEVNLWLDGACNYLWSIVAGLVFLKPFVDGFLSDNPQKSIVKRVLFVIAGAIAGGFLENTSFAVMLMAALFMAGIIFIKRRRPQIYLWLSLGLAAVSYYFMMSAPGTAKNKAAEFTLGSLRLNFITALNMFNNFRVLLIVIAVLFTIAVIVKIDRDKIIISAVFAVGALAANFILTFASYYPERCAACIVVFLVASASVLAYELFDTSYKTPIACLMVVLLLITSYNVMVGVDDIYDTYTQTNGNIEYILECKENAILDVTLPLVTAKTKYSAAYALKYLDTQDPLTWPNYRMATYYGLNSIIGNQ